jgi:hypothetical protein
MSRNADKHVRFYFGVSVSYLIPQNPHVKRDNVSDDKWEDDYLDGLRVDVEDKLPKEGFDVAYRKHTPIDGALRLYDVDFVVSALHPFPAVQLFTSREGIAGFSVKTEPFSKAKAILERKIADALKLDYVINAIAYEYAASRTFVYEEYLEGDLRIEHIISQSEINDAEGRVREAIEQFNDEVADLLQPCGWDVRPKTTTRRPRDNVYEFELSATKHNSYSEEEVCGSLVLLEKGMSASEAANLGIDTIDPTGTFASNEAELRDILDYDSSYTVIELTVCWVDYDEDVYEIWDELV